jgi:magnesium-transporting ATPase (P-type)
MDVMILILLVAAMIAWMVGDRIDMTMILVIVLLNASLGFSQEYRAEKALAALRRLEQPQVVVRRNGALVQITSQMVVPGDVMALEAGQRVSADGRLIEVVHLKVDESHLTGESVAVAKHTRALHGKDIPLGDRGNMVFMGTTVMTGHAWAVVTETGMKRPPRHPKESLFAGGLGLHILWVGFLMGLGTIGIFGWALGSQGLVHGHTVTFFTLTLFQMFHVLAIRSERDALWTIGLFSNPGLMGAVLLTILLQLAITYHPVLQTIFHTTALEVGALTGCIAVASTVYFAVEIEKWWRYRRKP